MVKSGSLFALVAVVLLAVTVSGSDGKFKFEKNSVFNLSGFVSYKNTFQFKRNPCFNRKTGHLLQNCHQ